jgi:type II secretory pathway component PulJ
MGMKQHTVSPTTSTLRRKKGYTLIELAVSIIAILLLFGTGWSMFVKNIGSGNIVSGDLDTQADARLALSWMTTDIRRAHQLKIEDSKMTLNCFTGKPNIGYPNAGLDAAQVEIIEYFRKENELHRFNKTTNEDVVVSKNVTDFRPTQAKSGKVVALILEAELEVMIERNVYDRVKTVVYTKVYPRHIAEREKYKGYFCSVDEDGTY